MTQKIEELDALIIGGGFGGVYLLYKLREAGFKAKIYEWGSELGGVWHWNHYPGARVDSYAPTYEFSIEELWKDWHWKERFPDWKQLQAYFAYVDRKLDISKDVHYDSFVTAAHFDPEKSRWDISTDKGLQAHAKFFLVANGFAAKKYVPEIKGLDAFGGDSFHSVDWPKNYDMRGKKIGILGTGSTGVQLIQEAGKVCEELVVFQRSPNLTLPMGQEQWTPEQQDKKKDKYPEFFEKRLTTFSGMSFDFVNKSVHEVSDEERERFFEELYAKGGFHFWLATYKDILFEKKANDYAYDFWMRKARARITDEKKADILAPKVPIYPFGTKRASLEQDYYEILSQDNVTVVDLRTTPIVEVTKEGVVISDGRTFDLDTFVLATGFDAFTGGFTQMDIRGLNGTITEDWAKGVKTYLGMSVHGFPNMFFMYGPQSPCALANGPTLSEIQGDWIVDKLKEMREKQLSTIEAGKEAEEVWGKRTYDLAHRTLVTEAKSWYMGANIPGKVQECLIYLSGVGQYREDIKDAEFTYA